MTGKPIVESALSKFETERVVPVSWRTVAIPASEADAHKTIARCLAIRQEVLRRIRLRVPHASKRQKRDFVRLYTLAQTIRVGVYHDVLTGRGIAIGADGGPSAIQVVMEGRELGLCASKGDPMVIYRQGEGTKARGLCVFSPWDKARQVLAHDVLKAVTELPCWMFVYNGGEPAALKWLRSELGNAELVLVTDFPKCFPLLPWQSVVDGLLLSERVIKALLFDPWKRVKAIRFEPWKNGDPLGPLFYGGSMEGLKGCAGEIGHGRGIPLGSALSSLAAQGALQLLLRELAAMEGIKLGLFADNLVVLLADKSKEALVRNSLMSLSSQHFDDIITAQFLQRTFSYSPEQTFQYLGRLVAFRKGDLSLEPLAEHNLRIASRVAHDIDSAKSWHDLRKPVERLKGYLVRHGCAPSAATAVLEACLDVGSVAAGFKLKDGSKPLASELLKVESLGDPT